MNYQHLLNKANATLLYTLLAFIGATILAYGFENQLPLTVLVMLHISQLILGGVFKISYVVRLAAQKQLGLELR